MSTPGLGRRLAGTALLLAGLSLGGKLIGLLREVVVARAYGTGVDLDAFLIGFTLPEILSYVALFVALNLFIPIYLGVRERDELDAERFAGAFLLRAGVLLSGVAAVLALAAGTLVSWVAPDLVGTSRGLAVDALRWLSAVVVLRGVEGALRGFLNARRRFVLPQAASLSVSLVVALSVSLLAPSWGIRALLWGVLVGNVVPVLLLVPATLAAFPAFRRPSWSHPGLKLVRERLPWFVGIEALGLVLPLIDRALASRSLDAGAISALSFARILYEVPFQALGYTLAVALFPELATLSARGDHEGFRSMLRRGTRALIAVLLPIAVLLVILHEPVVRAVFQRGAFDATATELTSGALWAFALGLPFMGAAMLTFQGAYASGRHRLLLAVRVACLVLKVVLSLWLMPRLGHVGLALATAAYHLALFGALVLPLLGSWRGLVPRPLVLLGAAAAAGAAAWGVTLGLQSLGWGGIPTQAAAWLAAGGIYWALCRWGGVEEVAWVESLLRKRSLPSV